MSEQCILCGSAIPFLAGRKTSDGCICKECSKNIPHSIPAKLLTLPELRKILSYEGNLKKREFSITASYGKLYLDELHGSLIISDRFDTAGNPAEPFEIYDLSDLKEIGLYPVKIRAEKKQIVCDVEFTCRLNQLSVPVKMIIKTSAGCSSKQVDKTHVIWDEPGELSMFRNMINQAIKNALDRQIKASVPEFTKHGFELFQAESALLLRDGYSEEEVIDHRERLLQAFQPKDGNDNTKIYLNAINYYYTLVMEDLRERQAGGVEHA